MSRSPFDALVAQYDAARPSYPPAFWDALDALVPLRGTTVVEVGAGTGISTRGLLARGADVAAFDLAPNMLSRLVALGSPGPGRLRCAAVADGHRLPVRDGAAGLVCYAQAFHWMRPEHAVPEARRVAPATAVWWNDSDARSEPWWQVQQDLLETLSDDYGRDYREHDPATDLRIAYDSVETAVVPWVRRISVDDYLVFLSSKSYVAALGEREPAFLDAQRALLTETFPDGTVEEPFVTRLWVGY